MDGSTSSTALRSNTALAGDGVAISANGSAPSIRGVVPPQYAIGSERSVRWAAITIILIALLLVAAQTVPVTQFTSNDLWRHDTDQSAASMRRDALLAGSREVLVAKLAAHKAEQTALLAALDDERNALQAKLDEFDTAHALELNTTQRISQNTVPTQLPKMPALSNPTCGASAVTSHLTSGYFTSNMVWMPTSGALSIEADACSHFETEGISLLLFIGDSMAANLAIDARIFLQGSAEPTKNDCWNARHGYSMDTEGACRESLACEGKLRIRMRYTTIATTNKINDVAHDLASRDDHAVVFLWFGLWYLINNSLSEGVTKIGGDSLTMLSRIIKDSSGASVVFSGVIGPAYSWCELHAGYCPRQGPDNIQLLGGALKESAALLCVPFFDIFDLTQKAGIGAFENDGTHVRGGLNQVIFRLLLHHVFSKESRKEVCR